MRNRFPGTCYRCGQLVRKGEGHFERQHDRWQTQHAECAIKYRGTDAGRNGFRVARAERETIDYRARQRDTGAR